QLSDRIVSASGARWSPDGRMLAFGGSLHEGDSLSGLWLVDVASGECSRLAGDALRLEGSTFAWHPDGGRLATIGQRNGLHETPTVDVADGAVRGIVSGLHSVLGLCPSGERLVFTAADMRHPDAVHSLGWDGAGECRHTALNRRWFSER